MLFCFVFKFMGFPGSSAGEESICNAGDPGSIPGLGRSPGKGKGYPLQYSRLENSMDCIVHGVAKSLTRLSDFQIQPWQNSSPKSNSSPNSWAFFFFNLSALLSSFDSDQIASRFTRISDKAFQLLSFNNFSFMYPRAYRLLLSYSH